MKTVVRNESGYQQAVEGIGFSYKIEDYERLEGVAYKLCDKDGGHNKFLESIVVWIEITAPRYWWQQFDTYRVGTTKQSESTEHTLAKKPLTRDDFEHPVSDVIIDHLNDIIAKYNKRGPNRRYRRFWYNQMKASLPEGFLQKRMVCTNYKVLANIIHQRKHHTQHEWHQFIEDVLEQIEHPELLLKRYGEERPWKLKG